METISIRSALEELVDLKDIKDAVGKTEIYEKRQPIAWINARQALEDDLKGNVHAQMKFFREIHRVCINVSIGTSGQYHCNLWKWRGGAEGWEEKTKYSTGKFDTFELAAAEGLIQAHKFLKDESAKTVVPTSVHTND